MDRIPLKAQERQILGKKVKQLRHDGFIPAHVFGKKLETEHVSVKAIEFLKVFHQAGETGLIDLKIGAERIRPVLVRGVQHDPVKEGLLHIDFYQVNLAEKVVVPVPIILVGEEQEIVHNGEAVVIQPLSEIEVEALPGNLPENIEVDTSILKAIGDAILVSGLKIPADVTVLADPEAVVAKLDSAVTEEMKQLLEEQAAETAAVVEAEAVSAEAEEKAEAGEEVTSESEKETEEQPKEETPE